MTCLYFAPSFSRWRVFLQPEQNQQERAQHQDGEGSSKPQHVGYDRAVFSGGGIVVIAVEQDLIYCVADLALRGFYQPHAEVFRRKIHAVEIARDAALRRQHHDGGGVCVLVDFGIVLILKADGFGERVNRLRGAGQEVPAGRGAGTTVALEVVLLLGGGDGGCFLRIEADRDDIEFVAEVELHHFHGAGQAGENLTAQHGAVVVNQVQDQRLPAEVICEFDGASGFVDEGEIGWNLGVEMLLDADVLQIRRANVGGRGHDAFGHGLSPGLGCEQGDNYQQKTFTAEVAEGSQRTRSKARQDCHFLFQC